MQKKLNHFITKDKNFYKQLLAIALPIALQNIINFSVAMADTVMVSQLGVTSLAGVNLANKFSTVFTLFTFGLGGGANVLIAQYWGKKDVKAIRKVMSIMYRALFLGSLLFSIIAIFFPMQAMAIFSKDLATQIAGAEYLRIVGISYFFAGFASATTTLWRSIGSVNIAIIVYLSSLATNVFLNWVFIFGNLGAPALGPAGAAIGTLSARIVEVIIVLIYMRKYETKVSFGFKDLFASPGEQSHHFFIVARPVVINEIIWGLGATFISIIFGRMGPDVTAAEAVCSVIAQLVTIFIWGVGHASAAITGNTIGAGENEKAKEYARTFMFLGIILGIFSCFVVLLVKNPVVSIFNLDTELAINYAKQMITVYAFVVIFQSLSSIGLIGILRGAGNSKFVLIMDLVFMWLICIPLGYIAGIKLSLPVALVYAILKCEEVFKASAAIVKISKGNWIHNLTNLSSNEK